MNGIINLGRVIVLHTVKVINFGRGMADTQLLNDGEHVYSGRVA